MEGPVTATPPPNSSDSPSPAPLRPAVTPSVQLSFTILYTTLYAGLFVVVYVQLWLLYIYGHKRWSYQSGFLYLCLLWAALRTTLFSFYFHDALQANHLPVAVFWLLYCFPVCLQFFTLSLINLYFTQVRLKGWGRGSLLKNLVSFRKCCSECKKGCSGTAMVIKAQIKLVRGKHKSPLQWIICPELQRHTFILGLYTIHNSK